jgi:hypothetical protein
LGEHRLVEAEVESLAGYNIVKMQTNPGARWLESARIDLVTEYTAMNHPA